MNKKRNIKKNYYLIAWVVDGFDLILGLASFIGGPLEPIINNIRGVIYDGITIPIIFMRYGGKTALFSAIELIVPDEIDMFIPTATISAYLSRRKNRR